MLTGCNEVLAAGATRVVAVRAITEADDPRPRPGCCGEARVSHLACMSAVLSAGCLLWHRAAGDPAAHPGAHARWRARAAALAPTLGRVRLRLGTVRDPRRAPDLHAPDDWCSPPARLPLDEVLSSWSPTCVCILAFEAVWVVKRRRSGTSRAEPGRLVSYTLMALLGVAGAVLVETVLLLAGLRRRTRTRTAYAIVLFLPVGRQRDPHGFDIVRLNRRVILGWRAAFCVCRGHPVRLRDGDVYVFHLGLGSAARDPEPTNRGTVFCKFRRFGGGPRCVGLAGIYITSLFVARPRHPGTAPTDPGVTRRPGCPFGYREMPLRPSQTQVESVSVTIA